MAIPAIRDRVVQGALKLILEPIFEADLPPEIHAYRAGRNARGIDLRDPAVLDNLAGRLERAFEAGFQARPGIGEGSARDRPGMQAGIAQGRVVVRTGDR